jgi:hypothetical protein
VTTKQPLTSIAIVCGPLSEVGRCHPASLPRQRCSHSELAVNDHNASVEPAGAGVIVHTGRKRRPFNGALREAIQAIDPVCSWLGCILRVQICDIDHLEPHSTGGPTDPANSAIMCHKHNLFKHNNGYSAKRIDRSIAITRPDSTARATSGAA